LKWDGRVIELTADDFDHWTSKFDALFVNIYAPWCGHCKDFASKYDEIGQALFDNSPRYFAAKLDGHAYKEIFQRFNP
jgi:thiol-disulfide isomerase/thioredoxin